MIEMCDKQGTRRFYSVEDVEIANDRAGQHFFDRDTMRFFNSRVLGELIEGRYFVTSERFDENSPRLYTIREALPNGHVETVGEFQAYSTAAQAYSAARKIASEDCSAGEPTCNCGVEEHGLAYHTYACPAYQAGHRTPCEPKLAQHGEP